MCLPDGTDGYLAHAPVQHLAFLHQAGNRFRYRVNRHLGIGPVLVQQVDVVGFQPPQRALHCLSDGLRAAVQPHGNPVLDIKADFGCDLHLIPHIRQRFAQNFLAGIRAVHLSGIEKGFALFKCLPRKAHHVLFLRDGRISGYHPHAAQSDRADGQRTCFP